MTDPDRPTPEQQAAYDELFDVVLPLYEAQRYDEALDRLARRGPDLEHWSADLTHITACLQELAGRPEEALATLRKALDDGQWWAERILVEDDDLAPLRELAGWDDLVREADARAHAYNASAPAEPPVLLRPDGTARGVAVVLHGSGQRAAPTAETWKAATAEGFAVLAVASSQRSTPTHTSWPDQGQAGRDVAHALETLDADLRDLPVVAGGFSAGGRAALLWAMTGEPAPVARLLAVAPSLAPEQLPDDLTDVPGSVLLGADDDLAGPVQQVADRLEAAGLRVETVAGLGHDYPADFPARLTAELRAALTPDDAEVAASDVDLPT
jgi:dienelactone hydrolase